MNKQLLSPKCGDTLVTLWNLDGWRYAEVSVGSKWTTIRPVNGAKKIKKISTREAKRIMEAMYWREAATDAYYKALELGKKHRPLNWKKEYA